MDTTQKLNKAHNSFFSKSVNPSTENLESYTAGQGAPIAINFRPTGTAKLKGSGSINTVTSGTDDFGRNPISGNN